MLIENELRKEQTESDRMFSHTTTEKELKPEDTMIKDSENNNLIQKPKTYNVEEAQPLKDKDNNSVPPENIDFKKIKN